METIKLPDSEFTEMKQFYQEEYDRTARRLQHIGFMLERLGVSPDSPVNAAIPLPEKPEDLPQKPVRKSTKPKRRTGRKSKWELLIIKRLRQLDKPVTYDELTDEIMAFSKIPEEKRKSTKQAIVNVIFRLRSRDKKLDTFSMGTKEKYIALKGWFDEPGVIKKEYADKVDLPKAKKIAGKTRRRPKKTA